MDEDYARKLLESLPARISDIINPWATRTPHRSALVEASGTWTYAQLAAVVCETKELLVNYGIRPGDRVMLVCENCRACVALLLAVAALDAWPVLVNARLSPHEIDQIQNHCGARRTIYTPSVSVHALKHAKRHNAFIGEVGNLGTIAVGGLNENVEAEPVYASNAEQVGVLIYTSGSTGLPKGVMLTHRNLLFIAAVSGRIRSLTPEDRLYGILPMSHIVGLSAVLLGTLFSGATLYLSPRFDPVAALAALERDKLTVVLGVPGMFALLVEYARTQGVRSLRLPALRVISSSGAPLDSALRTEVEELFGMVLHNNYGLTECSPTIAQARLDETRRDTSVGRVLPGVDIRLVGSDGEPVAAGEVGELWTRGPNLMKGYYRAPEETAAAINTEGWFNTRDLARLDDGHLFIVGRTRELIIHSGFNVYPAEVEAALNSHPAVARSAVVGQPVDGDEEVVAFVQLLSGSKVSTSELTKHAAQHLTSYKQPSKIVIVASMPETSTGKVAKRELSKMLSGG
jgi:long-chain acyl-CoA synthetase